MTSLGAWKKTKCGLLLKRFKIKKLKVYLFKKKQWLNIYFKKYLNSRQNTGIN